jgi:hypothetical protein
VLVDVPPGGPTTTASGRGIPRADRPLRGRRRRPPSGRGRALRLALGLEVIIAAVCVVALAAPSVTRPLRSSALDGVHIVAASQPPPTATPDRPGIAITPLPAHTTFDVPDPYLYQEGGTYYLYLSTPFLLYQENVPLLIGRPGHWSAPRDAMPTLPPWATPNPRNGQPGGLTWEPEVNKFGSTYVMYSAPTVAGSNPTQHCIAVALSRSPVGPFVPEAQPLVCQRNLGGDIDAQLYKDPTGPNGASHPYYLVWKSDNNSTRGDGIPTVWSQALSNDGRHLVGSPKAVFAPDEPWQNQLIEAPQLVRARDGGAWLFYSGGSGFYTSEYGMGAAYCRGPFGPCVDESPQPLVTTNALGIAPGEETAFVGHDGSLWLLYNPWSTGQAYNFFRPAEAVRIGMTNSSVYVAQAGTFPGPG